MLIEFLNSSLDYQAFSDNEEVQKIAKEALSHISKLYPIYIIMRYHGGEALTNEQINYLDIISDLVTEYEADITLVLNEQDSKTFHAYDEDNCFKYLIHSCYDSSTELTNNVAKIKNFILKSAASRFGNKNINWIFLIEEGIQFSRFTQNKFLECSNVETILITLGMWQYLSTKKVYSDIIDENGIGLSGICSSSNDKTFMIDKVLLSSAMLINLSECNRKHIEFDWMNDLLEDIDFNINMFANGLHVIGIGWPLSITKTLKEYRSDKKVSNFAAGIWAKWGEKVVKNMMVNDHKIIPQFATDFSNIINEYNTSNKHRIIWPKNEVMLTEYISNKKKLYLS